MNPRLRTIAACNQSAADGLLRDAFTPRPVFRMGFDHHVQRWMKDRRADLWRLYWADPVFAARYDACVQAGRMAPLPEWGVQP